MIQNLLTASCCDPASNKCMTCQIDTSTGDYMLCTSYIDPSMNTDNPRNDDGVLEQPPTSPNDNSGFPKGGVAENPETSPKVPFNKGGVLAQ